MKPEEMSLDEAWNLIGEACYAYKNKQVRIALMLVRADIANIINTGIVNVPIEENED